MKSITSDAVAEADAERVGAASSSAPPAPFPSTISQRCAQWAASVQFEDFPSALRDAARWRLLDTLGGGLAATALPAAQSVSAALDDLDDCAGGRADVLGGGRAGAPWAALANGTLFHALIFDDTHNETIIHPDSVIVATALAAAQATHASGRAFLTALLAGSELACRIGLAAVRRFHAAGFQPTAVIGPLAAACAAGRLYGLDARQIAHAVGIAGSFASGIIESWADGAWAQLLHPGWAAHSGITAAALAKRGFTGPATVIEGHAGVFSTHTRAGGESFAFARVTEGLGEHWESEQIAFKPYPCGHVIHPFLDAVLALHRAGLKAEEVERIVCPIADYMIGVVCEPVAQKRRPHSDAQARTSLQYSLAEALVLGCLDARGYREESLRDPRILALADKIDFRVDETAPDSRTYKGWVIVQTVDGRTLEHVEASARGSAAHPMTEAELRAKFAANASLRLSSAHAQRVADLVFGVDELPDLDALMRACRGEG
jgi:2-methylcitrate dehydratase PrpD